MLASITRSPAQGSACKDLSRNDQARVIAPEAAYTPTLNAPTHAHTKKHAISGVLSFWPGLSGAFDPELWFVM
ncbi:ATP-dependent nuclease subunit B [Lacticaseibacillus zeae]|uniref:ATP-dependent nuclease subunit B n=1 Tax=Lacticaseibacillus zeae TaxID=57037 RepID=A0A5R8LRL4_LACZE|nr:ATP-dependent nuclease subunit B [Lacticaseibacillus zeae]